MTEGGLAAVMSSLLRRQLLRSESHFSRAASLRLTQELDDSDVEWEQPDAVDEEATPAPPRQPRQADGDAEETGSRSTLLDIISALSKTRSQPNSTSAHPALSNGCSFVMRVQA